MGPPPRVSTALFLARASEAPRANTFDRSGSSVDQPSGFRPRPRSRTFARGGLVAGSVALLMVLVVSGLGGPTVAAHPDSSAGSASAAVPSEAAVSHPAGASDASRSGAVTPANNSSFNPTCAKINTTVCVSIANQGEPEIVPPAGGFFASVEPTPKTDLPLIIKSRYLITTTTDPKNGPESPIALNVTGKLWNGDTYATADDGTVWHSNNGT